MTAGIRPWQERHAVLRNSVDAGNDENMMLLHGLGFQAEADVYVNEFMRLFNNLYFRTVAVRLAKEKQGDVRKAAILEPLDRRVDKHFKPGG